MKEKYSQLTIRPANRQDALLLFNWANDKTVRKNAIHSEEIKWENHIEWFNNRIENPSVQIFILEDKGNPLGQIRYEKKADYWIIDYSIDIKHRGNGLGQYIIKETMAYFTNTCLCAKVKIDNIASYSVFVKLAFKKVNEYELNGSLFLDFKKKL